jgi:hypothetical protein
MAPISYAHSLDPLALAEARTLIVRPLRSQLGKPLSPNGVRRPDADPIRKARFRESARAIVAKDRHDRKYGLPVDTAGAVARAMERAYREGFADAQGEPAMPAASDAAAGETIDWALIPPRPRTAFWTICLFILGKGERTDGAGHLVPATTERNTAGWQLIWPAAILRKSRSGKGPSCHWFGSGFWSLRTTCPSACWSRHAGERPGGGSLSVAANTRRI